MDNVELAAVQPRALGDEALGAAGEIDEQPGYAGVETALLELVQLMPQVLRSLKRQATFDKPAVAGTLRTLLAAGSLGPRHLPVIVVLSLQGPMPVSELAKRIGLGVAATSLMVSELARAGVVEREVDERDRRRTLVSIAEPLREDCERFARERLEPLRQGLECMGSQTRAHFVAGWRILAELTVGGDGDASGDDAAAEQSDGCPAG